MASNIKVNITENIIENFNAQITGQQVTLVHPKPKRERPKYIWFQMRDTITTFTGRTVELETIHKTLYEHKICIVCGLAGIGKSETCRFYAWKNCEFYGKNVIWIDAESPYVTKELFQNLANELQIIDTSTRTEDSVIREIYSYFEKEKCLFIFDNVKSRKEIAQYLPSILEKYINIYILITSQNTEWGKLKSMRLLELPKTDAVQLIITCLKNVINTENEMDNIEELVHRLQYMPLALQQAAAYIEDRSTYIETDFPIGDYIRIFEAEEVELLSHTYDDSPFPNYSENDYNKTVFISISMILKKIRERRLPLAVDILFIISYYAPHEIKKKILQPLLNRKDDLYPLNESVRTLKKYALVTYQDTSFLIISIHRLVQSVVRQHIKREGLEKKIISKAIDLILTEDEKHGIQSWYTLRYALEIDFLCEYCKSCTKKSLLWFNIARTMSNDMVSSLLQNITDVDYFKNDSIISDIAFFANSEIVQLLAERGASINVSDEVNTTAVAEMASYSELDAVKYLVSKGADINKMNNYKWHPLTYAALGNDMDMLKYLIEAGSDLNTPNLSALQVAAIYGNTDIIKVLLDNGANIDAMSTSTEYLWAPGQQQTALDCAAIKFQLDIVQYLLVRGARLISDGTLSILIRDGSSEVLKLLLDFGIYDVYNFPWEAILVKLYKYKIKLKRQRYNLLYEVFCEFCPLKTFCLSNSAFEGDLNSLRTFIKKRIHLKEECNGNTIYHYAVAGNQLDVVKYLISADININHINKSGKTALSMAAENGHYDIVVYLYESGADPNIYNEFDSSPICLALSESHSEIVKYLINKGANVNEKTSSGKSLVETASCLGLSDLVCFFEELDLVADISEDVK